MSIQISEDQLYSLGMRIDPDNPTQAIHVTQQAESIPDESWDLDRLGIYAHTGLNESNRLLKESIQLGRRSTVQIFRSGRALSIARRKVPWGQWERWLVTHNLKKTTAWEAIELYQRAGSEEAIADLTPSQAKTKFGIGTPPQTDTHKRARPHNPSSDSSSENEDEPNDEPGEDEPNSDEGLDDPDVISRPPKTAEDILVASRNLLFSLFERPGEVNGTCVNILAEIETGARQLREVGASKRD
jgi:hypothetical protein